MSDHQGQQVTMSDERKAEIRAEIRAEIEERRSNCVRIAAAKSGDERIGWLEDEAVYRDTLTMFDALQAAETALATAKEQGFAVGTDAALELVHGLFSDSMHENWNKDEITDAIDALRKQFAAREEGE